MPNLKSKDWPVLPQFNTPALNLVDDFKFLLIRYGDYYPKTVIGRFVAMMWILFGTVILSMFTASITTGLITACLSSDIPLTGTRVSIYFS